MVSPQTEEEEEAEEEEQSMQVCIFARMNQFVCSIMLLRRLLRNPLSRNMRRLLSSRIMHSMISASQSA